MPIFNHVTLDQAFAQIDAQVEHVTQPRREPHQLSPEVEQPLLAEEKRQLEFAAADAERREKNASDAVREITAKIDVKKATVERLRRMNNAQGQDLADQAEHKLVELKIELGAAKRAHEATVRICGAAKKRLKDWPHRERLEELTELLDESSQV